MKKPSTFPLIFRQPGRIPADRVFEGRTCNYDFFPSVLNYLGLQDRIADTPNLPGVSYAPALMGKEIAWNNEIFHEFENARMVRNDRWKYTWRHPDGPNELYDILGRPRKNATTWRTVPTQTSSMNVATASRTSLTSTQTPSTTCGAGDAPKRDESGNRDLFLRLPNQCQRARIAMNKIAPSPQVPALNCQKSQPSEKPPAVFESPEHRDRAVRKAQIRVPNS